VDAAVGGCADRSPARARPTRAVGLDTIAAQVSAWIDAGTAPATIAVLARDKFRCERLSDGLTERGVPARIVDRDAPATDRVSVMTMHRAKGMEFSKVVLAAVGAQSAAERQRLAELDEIERADAELRRRSLLYVAATRARDELVVVQQQTTSGTSQS
jgi:superfamily I DNA/RNA helicase